MQKPSAAACGAEALSIGYSVFDDETGCLGALYSYTQTASI